MSEPRRDDDSGYQDTGTVLSDTLNAKIGVLARREVEARLLAPILDALGEEFGLDRVRDIVSTEIVNIAREQGRSLVDVMGGDSLEHFAESLKFWTKDDALEIRVLERSEATFAFDVTRCRYAELYQALGVPELGAMLSCNRDFALVEGFNAELELTRTRTIMEGAPCCDFRYRRRSSSGSE